ncbi:MAG: hypothetical protein AB7V32_06865 [Candidatus Berkiella sp.]
MLRELSLNEVNAVAGGAINDIIEVIPASIPGYALVGWTEQVVGFDTVEWTEYVGFWGTPVLHKETSPIYDIQPLYAPVVTTTYMY